jgi:hypothetical protein
MADTDKTLGPAASAAGSSTKATNLAPNAAPQEKRAVLRAFHGDTPPGRVVRGAPALIDKLVADGKARIATQRDVNLAGGRVIGIK